MNMFDVIDCHLFHFKGNPGCIISQQSEQQHTAFFWEGDGWWSGVAIHITEDKCPIQLFVLCITPLVYDYMICNRSTHSMLSFISFNCVVSNNDCLVSVGSCKWHFAQSIQHLLVLIYP